MTQTPGNIYETFFSNSVEGIIIFDTSGKIVKANAMAGELLGAEENVLEHKNIEDIIGKKYTSMLHGICTALIAGKTHGQRNELIMPDFEKNGKQTVLGLHLNNHIRAEDGSPMIAAVVIDETQDWNNRQELKESHERFRKSFYNNPIAQLIIHESNRIIKDANKQFIELSGYTHDEVIGEHLSSVGIAPCEGNRSDNMISLFTENIPNCEAILRIKNGNEINVLQSFVSIKLNGTPHELWTIIDLTAIKQAERNLKYLNEVLEHKVRERTHDLTHLLEREKLMNDLKTRFVSMASHEFRTPLTAILASAGLIETYINSNDTSKCSRHIERIKSSVHSLTEILEDFLSLEKIARGELRPLETIFDIRDFAEKINHEMKASLKKEQHITFIRTGPEMAKQDVNMLKNLVLNLLSNASKYSGEGETISWTISVKKDKLIITVADSGIGIPEDDQAHIFSRFFRAKNAEVIQGTGLGLHIAKKYAGLLKGKISFVSTENVGSIFTIEVPLLQ